MFLLSLVVVQGSASVEEHSSSQPDIQTYPVPASKVYDNAIKDHRSIDRAKITLNDSINVDLLERPKSIDNNDSILILYVSGQAPRVLHIGRMIGDLQLRIVHAALVRMDSARGMLVLEYEGGSVGAIEGFAVLRFEQHSAKVHVLPLARYGKVVVSRGKQDDAEVWSGDCAGLPPDAQGCEYVSRMCTWGIEDYSCARSKKMKGLFSQYDTSDPGIEIRP